MSTRKRSPQMSPADLLPPLVALLHLRPELGQRGWGWNRTSLAGSLVAHVLEGA